MCVGSPVSHVIRCSHLRCLVFSSLISLRWVICSLISLRWVILPGSSQVHCGHIQILKSQTPSELQMSIITGEVLLRISEPLKSCGITMLPECAQVERTVDIVRYHSSITLRRVGYTGSRSYH